MLCSFLLLFLYALMKRREKRSIIPHSESVGIVLTVRELEEAELVAPFVVTVMVPVVAPLGITTVSCVEVAVAAVALTPPVKFTWLLEAVVSKFVPVMVMVDEPAVPVVGVKLEMVGVGRIVNELPEAELAFPFVVTVIVPVVAPLGTVTVIDVLVEELAVAVTPPVKPTVFCDAVALKFVPVMVISLPTATLVGEKEVMVGVA